MEVVEKLTYLRSTISSLLSIDSEVNSRIAEAAAVMVILNQRVKKNPKLTEKT